MKKINKLVIFICISAVLISLFIFLIISNMKNENNERNIIFIDNSIDITGNVDEKLLFPLVFLAESNINIDKKITKIEIIDKEIDVSKWEIKNGSIYKDMQLYSLNLEISSQDCINTKIKGLRIYFLDNIQEDYLFSDWKINIINSTNDFFQVHKKEAYINSKYMTFFDLENISDKQLSIKSLGCNNKDYLMNKVIVKQKSKDIENPTNILIDPNEIIEVELYLNESVIQPFSFIRPFIEYSINNSYIIEPITQGSVYNTIIEPSKMEEMYNKINVSY